MSLKTLDLFCGCGGLTTGLKNAGFDIIAGIDIWDKAIESYRLNHSDHFGICADLTELPPDIFQQKYGIDSEIDVIAGGPPCQSFSMAGKRDVNDPRSSLFMEYVKYIRHFQPKAFIFENVMGILSAKLKTGEKAIDVILSFLSENYECIVCKLYASDFGVPQNRRRVIILGIRKDLKIIPTEPEPLIDSPSLRPAVGDVLIPREEVDQSLYLSQRAIDGINAKRIRSKAEGKGFGAQFLRIDQPSYTIPARYYKDGYDALVRYDETHIRRLSVLELKRIQSFPDDYQLSGNRKDQIMQIGNAVASRFATALGNHLRNLLSQS